jgi:hypothetical protein
MCGWPVALLKEHCLSFFSAPFFSLLKSLSLSVSLYTQQGLAFLPRELPSSSRASPRALSWCVCKCVCVCVCVCVHALSLSLSLTHTHTHTHSLSLSPLSLSLPLSRFLALWRSLLLSGSLWDRVWVDQRMHPFLLSRFMKRMCPFLLSRALSLSTHRSKHTQRHTQTHTDIRTW